jgi:hypothetical protein
LKAALRRQQKCDGSCAAEVAITLITRKERSDTDNMPTQQELMIARLVGDMKRAVKRRADGEHIYQVHFISIRESDRNFSQNPILKTKSTKSRIEATSSKRRLDTSMRVNWHCQMAHEFTKR